MRTEKETGIETGIERKRDTQIRRRKALLPFFALIVSGFAPSYPS